MTPLDQLLRWLDLAGVAVFAASGALVASRKRLDVVGMVVIASVAGFGGGTVRDLLLGRAPVFWLRAPELLAVCAAVAVFAFFAAHRLESRFRALLWADAVGMALYAVVGAEIALLAGASPWAAVLMGVVTATFGGVLRHPRRRPAARLVPARLPGASGAGLPGRRLSGRRRAGRGGDAAQGPGRTGRRRHIHRRAGPGGGGRAGGVAVRRRARMMPSSASPHSRRAEPAGRSGEQRDAGAAGRSGQSRRQPRRFLRQRETQAGVTLRRVAAAPNARHRDACRSSGLELREVNAHLGAWSRPPAERPAGTGRAP